MILLLWWLLWLMFAWLYLMVEGCGRWLDMMWSDVGRVDVGFEVAVVVWRVIVDVVAFAVVVGNDID